MPPPPLPADGSWVGLLLEGRYRVLDVLGAGGMGTVYLADDLRLARRVVIKVPHTRYLAEPGFRARFEKEIRSLLALDHPGIVKVYDAAEHDGVPYAVLQHLGGGSLKERVARAGGVLAPAEVAAWLPTVARALDAIHAKGVVHRDVKPANVLFDADGHVFLADFGIAKALGAPDTGLTATGMTPGSPDYMAPEVSLGTAIGPAYDQYALAVTVYQALTKRLPHDATDSPARILYQKAAHEPRPLHEAAPHVAAPAAAAVMKALAREPSQRFASCADFAAAFGAGATARAAAPPDDAIRQATLRAPPREPEVGEDVAARDVPASRTPAARPQPTGRRRALLLVALAGLCALVAWRAGWFSGTRAPSAGSAHETAQAPTPSPSVTPPPPAPAAAMTEAPPPPAPVVDTTAPTLVVEPAGPEVATATGEVTFTGTVTDDHGPLTASVDGEPVVVDAAGRFTHAVAGLAAGTSRVVTFVAEDGAHNRSAPQRRTVTRPVPDPAWKAALAAAEAAGRATPPDWDTAAGRYAEAVAAGVPTSAVAKWLEAGVRAWTEPATVAITAPADGTSVATASVTVVVALSTPRGDDTLWIGGTAVRTGPGEGRREVALAEGPNPIAVEARDVRGTVRATATVTVTRKAPMPTKPSWAKTSAEQDAYAAQAGVPVWHETDLGGGETLRFVLVPPGTFTMGSPATEERRQGDETLHEVTLTRGYYVSIGEVTNGQYRRWRADHDSGARFNGGTQPAVMVSHDDATGYATWLSARDGGRTYRLPTEAEWEYACRAGTATPFWFGATITPEQANYDGNASYGSGPSGPSGAYRQETTPLGTFAPNGWGLYDVHGNAWEWCAEWYGAYPAGRVQDPPGPSTGSDRVLRGGSWGSEPAYVRSAFRSSSPDVRGGLNGFRLVLVAPPLVVPPAPPPEPPAAMGEAPSATPTAPGAKPSWAKTSAEQEAYAAKAGLPVWHETDLGGGETLRFVLVPPGTFTMGSPRTEVGRNGDEAAHEVTLTQGYYVSIGEVTNGQYRRWKGDHDSGTKFDGEAQPAVKVSHDDATGYVAWLSARDGGRVYRLPTEAEWEYASRAGTTTPFWFGATITPEQANYDGNYTYEGGPKGTSRQQTSPLGTFAPNGWGLYDVNGNVWEWCADWYGAYPAGRVQDPPGPSSSSEGRRVLRGGSWFGSPSHVRSAQRNRSTPDYRGDDIGFRLVLVAPRVGVPPAPPPEPLAAMGEAPAPAPSTTPTGPGAKPAWAKTSAEQEAYAATVGLPVWHETDLGGGETLRFVLVPPGAFTMGSPTTEEWHRDGETAHEVTLTRGYYVSIGEVTNGQYRRWKGDHDSGAKFNGATQPVVMVSHDDATGYAAWLSARDGGRTYRLPTEAEWEYACRAGTTTPFWFGATITPEQANYDGNYTYGGGPKGAYREQTTPLGTFAPNAWGLYDVHGNVWEWCADWYGTYPSGRVQDPLGPSSGSARVLRGGSWSNSPDDVRSANRLTFRPVNRPVIYGFRLVLVAPRG